MDYFYFQFDNISSRNYNLVIQNKGEDLNFPSQPNFENQLVSPLYQNTNYLAGVNLKERTFNFNCWVDSITLEKTRELVNWLSVDKIGYLVLDYNPNFKYKVKVANISDFKHFPINADGTTNYEFTVSFISIEDFAAISNQTLVFDTNNYISETPIGINNDNGGPVTFNDLNYQTMLPEFKILNYYSQPINPNFIINVPNSGNLSVKLANIEYYNYSNNTGVDLNFFIDTTTGLVTINTSIDPYAPVFELAESITGITNNLNLGKMNIPTGESQYIFTTVAAKDPNFPYSIQFIDTENNLGYDIFDIASGNLYVVVQDGSYGDSSTTSYDPINTPDYIYNKINKDGTNSDISILKFNTDQPTPVSSPGQMSWNKQEGSLDLALSNNYILQIGEELFYYVKCATSLQGNIFGSISKGDAVMFAGFDEYQNILVAKASYAVLVDYPFFYLGIASEDITEGQKGYVTLFGRVGGLSFTYPAGTILYVDPVVPGGLTDTKPTAPLMNIVIGAAILPDLYSSGVGQIIVTTTKSMGVLGLHDVIVPTEGHPDGVPVTGDTLVYQTNPIPGYPGTWVTAPSINAAGGITVQDPYEVFLATNVEEALKELYDTKISVLEGYYLVATSEIDKLATVQANAQPNVQSNWEETDVESDAYILNKPAIMVEAYTLPTASDTVLGGVKIDNSSITINEFGVISSNSSGTVTEVIASLPLNVVNGTSTPIISIAEATSITSGIMSAADKSKLDAIEANADVNVNADWNATSGFEEILNKPTIPTQYTDQLAVNAVKNVIDNTNRSIELGYDSINQKFYAEAVFGSTENTVVEGNDNRLSDAREPLSHDHGNINNLGQIGSAGDLVVTTGTDGTLTAVSRYGIDSRETFPFDTNSEFLTNLETQINAKLQSTNIGDTGQVLTVTANGYTFEDSSSVYNLPVASDTILGGIKVGSDLSIEPDGTLNWTPGDTGLFLLADGTRAADHLDVNNTITSGHILPKTDVTYDLGSTDYKWRDLYLSGSSIHLGAATISENAGEIILPSGTKIGTVAAVTQVDIDNSIAALIDTAPSTLNTLNELAAALGDDPNFAATITTSLGTKAPIASPTFTGTVVLPNTTSIGTVSNMELSYLDGVTSAIQTQLNTKAFFGSTPTTGAVFYSGGGSNALQVLDLGAPGQVLSVGTNKPAWVTPSSGGILKNWIINGGFDVWQRGISFMANPYIGYTADGWYSYGTYIGRSNFAIGQTTVPNNPKYYYSVEAYNEYAPYAYAGYRIEDVRLLAGKIMTLSFWLNISAGGELGPNYFIVDFGQIFGTGGSSSISNTILNQTVTVGGWQKYSITFIVPSVAGKTITSNSYSFISIMNNTSPFAYYGFSLANVSLVEGSVAQEWQTEGYGEVLSKCQRYYYRVGKKDGVTTSIYNAIGNGITTSSTSANITISLPVRMRSTPTAVEYQYQAVNDTFNGIYAVTAMSIDTNVSSEDNVTLSVTSSGMTTGRGNRLINNNNANGYIAFSADL